MKIQAKKIPLPQKTSNARNPMPKMLTYHLTINKISRATQDNQTSASICYIPNKTHCNYYTTKQPDQSLTSVYTKLYLYRSSSPKTVEKDSFLKQETNEQGKKRKTKPD